MLDAAYWMKGCSSLGRLRYAVLLRRRARGGDGPSVCLIDIKEAVHAAAPRAPTRRRRMPADNAERVVDGARALSPASGRPHDRRRAPAASPVVLRELLPQDLKLEIEQLTRAEACKAARYLGDVVGNAHARQMDAGDRRRWQTTLQDTAPPSSTRRPGCGPASSI